MTIVLNGQPTDVPDGVTVRALVERLGLGTAAAAAEVNQRLVPRREHDTRVLSPGDRVEIVTLVGGG